MNPYKIVSKDGADYLVYNRKGIRVEKEIDAVFVPAALRPFITVKWEMYELNTALDKIRIELQEIRGKNKYRGGDPCKTDNDTEILMHLWEKNQIEAIAKNAGGYYALAILDRQGQLHIVRDSTANLFLSFSRTINSFIVATTELIINDLAKEMRWNITKPELILDNSYVIFKGNEVVYNTNFTPLSIFNSAIDFNVIGRPWETSRSSVINPLEIAQLEDELKEEEIEECDTYMHRGLKS